MATKILGFDDITGRMKRTSLVLPALAGGANTILRNDGSEGLTWVAFPTLQSVYDADVDGSNALITTTATDGSVVIAGTESLQVTANSGLDVNPATPGSADVLDIINTGTGAALDVDLTNASNNTDGISVDHAGSGAGFNGLNVTLSSIFGSGNGVKVTHAGTGYGLYVTSAGGGLRLAGASSSRIDFVGTVSGTLGIRVPSAITSHNWTLPATQGGASTILTNDGSGNLSWSPASSTLQDAYNNDANGSDALITTNATDGSVTIAGTESLKISATNGIDLTTTKITTTTVNGGVFIVPNGTGTFQLSITGNTRGTNAVDLQMVRTVVTRVASGVQSFLGAGQENTASGDQSAVVMGIQNTASGQGAAILTGNLNSASGQYAFIGGGASNQSLGATGGIGAGSSNQIQSSSFDSFVGGGTSNVITNTGDQAFIGGGSGNQLTGTGNDNAIVGGDSNTISGGTSSVIGGGGSNTISGSILRSVIAGGHVNSTTATNTSIGGGQENATTANYAVIPGGRRNAAAHIAAIVMGGGARSTADYDLVVGGDTNFNPSTTEKVHFRVAGDNADVHVGRQINQSAVAGASNRLSLHTILASQQARATSLKAHAALTASYDITLPNAQGAAQTTLVNDGSGNLSWAIATPQVAFKTANYTAVANDFLGADTALGTFTITLPASPSAGQQIRIFDAGGEFATNNLTIGRNGNNIAGLASDLILDQSDIDLLLVYYNGTRGWVAMTGTFTN